MEAVVMDCNGKNAVLLKKDGTFVTVRDASYVIGQKIETVEIKRNGIGQLAAAACLCLVIGLGAVGAKMWFTPYAHVEVCADYSVGFTLNRFKYVIDTEVESDDNAVLTEEFSQNVKNKKVTDAVSEAISHSSEKENVKVKVSSTNVKGQKKIQEEVAQSIGDDNINIEESETTQVQASHELMQTEIATTDVEMEETVPKGTESEKMVADESTMNQTVAEETQKIEEAGVTDDSEEAGVTDDPEEADEPEDAEEAGVTDDPEEADVTEDSEISEDTDAELPEKE